QLGGRAGHGFEIAFHFDNVATDYRHTSPPRERLLDEMLGAWVAFADHGDPNHEGLAAWPPYTLPERATMVFQRDGSEPATDPSAPARELWDRLLTRR